MKAVLPGSNEVVGLVTIILSITLQATLVKLIGLYELDASLLPLPLYRE
jgi:hypothetical protein